MLAALLFNLVYVGITALIGAATAAIVYARWHYGTLEKVKGLPAIIKPAFVGGSDVTEYKKIVHLADMENVKKYGKIYGTYEGRAPHIFIADPEMVRLIFIKDFDHFHNKRIIDFGHELINEMLDILPYEKWKVVRSALSPTLTTGKIRNMSLAMTDSIESWVDAIKTEMKGEEFVPRRMYTALTSDVIARCGFGLKLNSLHDPNNVFVKELNKFVADGTDDINYMLTVSQVFPFLASLSPFIPKETLLFFNDVLKSSMKARRESKAKVNDFVDILNEMAEKMETDEYKKLGITDTTIMAQALIFFFAGFETTASTLTFLSYNLAKTPETQEKLQQEVDAYLARHNGKIEHETINELTYLAACVQETLRMYPPLIRVERVCNKDWYHEPSGLHVPKDMVIQVPISAIHYNPEFYPDPYTFKPERFLPENKDKLNPYAFLSFGAGNHNCIGMRFAKEELYLTMAHVMKNFTFHLTPESKLKFRTGRTFLISLEPFPLKAVKRYEE